jgi:ligand-binding SRPBCC domain-containing protein
MPVISIKTKVKGSAAVVFALFDEKLFDFLAPPNWLAKKIIYEGSNVGDKVAMQFNIPVKSVMEVEISTVQHTQDKHWFIDQGVRLPFGLTQWRHEHIVLANEDCSIVHDKITYKTNNLLLDWAFYPFFYLAFYGRKKPYQKYFGSCKK